MTTEDELLLGLEEEGEDSDAEWARELERRAREVLSGEVELISPEEARRHVVECLERLRRER
jgi:hypothetical protein